MPHFRRHIRAFGSGKGTQSDKLIKEYRLYHSHRENVLRDHIARGTELPAKIAYGYIPEDDIPDDKMTKSASSTRRILT